MADYKTIPAFKVNRIYKTSHGYAKLVEQDFYKAHMLDVENDRSFTVPIEDLKMPDIVRELITKHPVDAYDMKKLIEQWNAETNGDWLPVYQAAEDPDPVIRSNFETILMTLQGISKYHAHEHWIYSSSRWVFADMSEWEILDGVEDLYAQLDWHGDLNSELSTEYQEAYDISVVEDNPPEWLMKNPPPTWPEQVYWWINQHSDSGFRTDKIDEAAFSLGFLSQVSCPNGHVRYQSNSDDHWLEHVTSNSDGEAYARYHEWLNQENGAMLTKVLPGFTGTHIPYPTPHDEWGDVSIDEIDGFYICPHCGTKMKEVS